MKRGTNPSTGMWGSILHQGSNYSASTPVLWILIDLLAAGPEHPAACCQSNRTSAQMQNVIAQCGRNPTVLVAAPLERSSTSRSEPLVS